MAQDGDTITYSYSGGTAVAEDVSAVDTAIVDYMDGAGGFNQVTTGGSGGRVENAEIDVSGQDMLYIWVAGDASGRYDGGATGSGTAGSTEISLSNTGQGDSSDEPFLVGAGGGGGGWFAIPTGFVTITGANGAGRGGTGVDGGGPGNGTAPPLGGDGAPDNSSAGGDGRGAIDDQNRGLVSGGTTITGGGSGPETSGEVQITYEASLSPPDPPTNLSAEVQ